MAESLLKILDIRRSVALFLVLGFMLNDDISVGAIHKFKSKNTAGRIFIFKMRCLIQLLATDESITKRSNILDS